MNKKDSIFEIERKFLIKYPDNEAICKFCDMKKTEITQTYLKSSASGDERVRKSVTDNEIVYTHTRKKRISAVRRIELEDIIDEKQYNAILSDKNTEKSQILKTRYTFLHSGQVFELDVYPFWNDKATLEIELSSENQEILFPPFLEIVREITGEKEYSNAYLAKKL